jgi:hypothetical protein
MRSPAKWFIVTLFSVSVALLGTACAVYWAAPGFLADALDRRLRAVPGYDGGVGSVRWEWLRPRLIVSRFRLDKRDATPPAFFLSADEIRVGLSRRELLRGKLVLELTLERPRVLFLMRQRTVGQPRKVRLWHAFFAHSPPFRVERLTVVDGALRFRNDQCIPPLDIRFDRVSLTADNLANRRSLIAAGPTTVAGRGRLMDHAPVRIEVAATPFSEHPAFRLAGDVKDLDLLFLNDILRHHTGLELKQGVLDMGGEFTAADGEFRGRVDRRIRNLSVRSRHRGMIMGVKEWIFQSWIDRREDDDTGSIDDDFGLSGPLGYTDQDVFLAAVWVAKSAFLQTLRARVPPDVRLDTPEQAQDRWAALQALERAKNGR